MGIPYSGSGLRCPSPVRLRRLLAPPPARSRKVPKRSPNVRKRNFLFPTLERAALRWLRRDLGTLFPTLGGLGVERSRKGGVDAEAPPSPPSPGSSLSTGRLLSPPPSSPPTCSSLRGQGSPPPLGWRAGGSGINPPPTRTFPPPLPRRPRARAGWTLRLGVLGGGVPAAPRPSTPSESGPGRGRGRGKGAGRRCSNLFPSPGGGCGSAPVCGCVPRPAHPPRPPSARRVGAALKGLGAGLWRPGMALGDLDRGAGLGQGCGVL